MTSLPRADAQLVKLLCRAFGAPYARDWQRRPFISVPRDVFIDWSGAEDTLHVPVGAPDKPLPYDDFVLHMIDVQQNHHPELTDAERRAAGDVRVNMDLFARVFSPAHAKGSLPEPLLRAVADPHLSPAQRQSLRQGSYRIADHLSDKGNANVASYALIVAISHFDGDVANRYIDMLVCSFEHPESAGGAIGFTRAAMGYEEDGSVRGPIVGDDAYQLMEFGAATINNTLGYLMQSPRHMMRVRPTASRVPTKTAQTKPWLRDDLPTIRLMGPDEALAAGQPRTTGGSVRAGPRPHARRGHWRRLGESDDGTIRKTFVRPAWIGPEAWEHAGRQYSLLRAAKEERGEAQ